MEILTFLILCLLVAYKSIKNLTSIYALPHDLSLFFRASHSAPRIILNSEEIVTEYEKMYGTRTTYIFKDENKATSPDLCLAGNCRKLIEGSDIFALTLSTNHKLNNHIDIEKNQLVPEKQGEVHIQVITLQSSKTVLFLQGLKVGKILVNDSFQGIIHIENCWIKSIEMNSSSSHLPASLSLRNTWVGNLALTPNCCNDFFVSKAGIANLSFTYLEHQQNNLSNAPLFTGNVSFEKYPQLKCIGAPARDDDIQSYRRISRDLKTIENYEAEKYVHGFIRRMERKSHSLFVRFMSFLYDLISFYGNIPERTLYWFAILMMISSLVVYSFSSPVATFSCEKAIGWHQSLCGSNATSEFARAFTLTVESTIKPFSILTSNTLVTTNSITLVFLLCIHSIISLILLSLFIISIRRKFIYN